MVIKLIFFFSLITSLVLGQTKEKYKSFKDSVFAINDKLICPAIWFDLTSPGHSNTYKYFIDSVDFIANFLNKYPKLKIELGGHTSPAGNSKSNQEWTQAKMTYIKNYLINTKRIDSTRIVAKGYGGKFPLIPLKTINAAKTRSEKDKLHAANVRTIIKILSTT